MNRISNKGFHLIAVTQENIETAFIIVVLSVSSDQLLSLYETSVVPARVAIAAPRFEKPICSCSNCG